MPPGPAYNWLAAAHTFAQILEHATHYRASQVSGSLTRTAPFREQVPNTHEDNDVNSEDIGPGAIIPSSSLLRANEDWLRVLAIPARPSGSRSQLAHQPLPVVPTDEDFDLNTSAGHLSHLDTATPANIHSRPTTQSIPVVPEDEGLNSASNSSKAPQSLRHTIPTGAEDANFNPTPTSSHHPNTTSIPPSATKSPVTTQQHTGASGYQGRPSFAADTLDAAPLEAGPLANMAAPEIKRALQSSRVPSSRIGRFFHYGGGPALYRSVWVMFNRVQVLLRHLGTAQRQSCSVAAAPRARS